ncbi:MAG TPA: CopD family protein [Candidatus Binataceae bacterium]
MIVGFIIALHLFGIIFWIGSLLLITRWLALVPDEVGIAKERFIVAAKRMFLGCNIGAAVAIGFGVVLIILEPEVLVQRWLWAKLLLVAAMLFFHLRCYRRTGFLEDHPGEATRGEFMMMHGVVSLLLLAILALAVMKPF